MKNVKQKSVVLLSGGLDSTVNFYFAKSFGEVVLALTFDYGQRAARSEIQAAQKICSRFAVPHQLIELPFIKNFGQSALIDPAMRVPTGNAVSIDNFQQSRQTAKSVWVPNRNGVFLNVAAGFAESLKADFVVPGFNAEEAATFPDNSEDFVKALNHSFSFSTSNAVRVQCWTSHLNKSQIVEEAKKLQVEWSDMWPCYFSGEKWCGQCESCLRAKRAFTNGQIDIKYLFAN